MKNDMIPTVSIVVPCYNEELALPRTVSTLVDFVSSLVRKNIISDKSKIVLVDDGSKDDTWSQINSIAQSDPYVSGIKLSKNFGHQNAVLAGLHYSMNKFDCAISIDADLQDDHLVMEKMITDFKEGKHIVYGVRSDRTSDTTFKKYSAQFFYKMMQFLGVKIIYNHADFRLMSAKAIEFLSQMPEKNVFLRGLVTEVGLPYSIVTYARKERLEGETKYPLKKMLQFAWDGVTSFSTKPLRMVTIGGFVIFFIAALLGLWAIAVKFLFKTSVQGWPSIVIPIYLLGGLQIFSIGILGEYLGKIYKETKQRPSYFIETIKE